MDDHRPSLAEIASYLGVSKDSVYRWVEKREMPAQKIGRQWKFKFTEVDACVRTSNADVMADPAIARKRETARPHK